MTNKKERLFQLITLHKNVILFVMAFTYFFVTTCFLLMNASIWLDEAVEYYMALPTRKIPEIVMNAGRWTTEWSNYYQRCLDTFQPPLYTFFIAGWLSVFDSELWFRLSGVFLGFIGSLGIWCIVKKAEGAGWASIAVIVYSFFRAVTRYNQECAEYSLMMAMLSWTLYFYFISMEAPNYKHYLLFITMGILAIYSQYGAAFPVFCLSCTLLVQQLCKKNWKAFFKGFISFSAAFFITIVPLCIFFLRRQLALNTQISGQGVEALFNKNIFLNIIINIKEVFSWILFQNHVTDGIIYGSAIFLVLLFIMIVILLVQRNSMYYWYFLSVVSTWILYNIIVSIGIYARGQLRARYSLFFAPLVIVFVILTIAEISKQAKKTIERANIIKVMPLKISSQILTVALMLILFFPFLNILVSENFDCLFKGRDYDIHGNDRALVSSFYCLQGYESKLYLERNSTFAFYYYLQHDKRFSEISELDVEQLYVNQLVETVQRDYPERKR